MKSLPDLRWLQGTKRPAMEDCSESDASKECEEGEANGAALTDPMETSTHAYSEQPTGSKQIL